MKNKLLLAGVVTLALIGGIPVYAWSATGLGPVYADPGTGITLFSNAVAGTGFTTIKDCSFYLSGHFVTTT